MDLPPPPPLPISSARTSALAIWSVVLAIVGLFICLPSVAGIICGTIALVKIGRSNGHLRGTGLAITGLILSVVTGTISGSLVLVLALSNDSTTPPPTQTLAEARQGFVTHLVRQEQVGAPVEPPPEGKLNLVHYHSALGDLPAYVSPIPKDGRKHPAIIWLRGGFSNSIGEEWESAPPENDQTAQVFWQSGIVTMYPSLRGGNENPGYKESFFGEVDDVIAATDFLAAQPGIGRIYLGGHSTGGTLALLVAETSARYRAVFSFGPVERVAGYGAKSLAYNVSNSRENAVRDPIRWLHCIKSPTYVFEGEEDPSNITSLRHMEAASKNPALHFVPMKGMDHFKLLRPTSLKIAGQILADADSAGEFVAGGIAK